MDLRGALTVCLSQPYRSPRCTFSGCDLTLRMAHEDARTGRTLGSKFSIVGKLCIGANPPGLNVIVVEQATGQSGEHVVLRKAFTVAREQSDVLKHNWFSVRVRQREPFGKCRIRFPPRPGAR